MKSEKQKSKNNLIKLLYYSINTLFKVEDKSISDNNKYSTLLKTPSILNSEKGELIQDPFKKNYNENVVVSKKYLYELDSKNNSIKNQVNSDLKWSPQNSNYNDGNKLLGT